MRDEKEIYHQMEQVEETKNGGKFKVSIKIPFDFGWIERVKVTIINNGKSQTLSMQHIGNQESYANFETTVELKTSAICHYYFSFEANGKFQYYKKRDLNGNATCAREECWKLSVGFDAPDWAKGAMMYHIFLDRYRKGRDTKLTLMPRRTIHEHWDEKVVIGPNENGEWNTDFFGGNLKGIIETLDYIKSLGVTIIYLSPICKSQSTHRYDTGDYEEVDVYAGCNDDLKSLTDLAHRKGMKVILDAVFNHTGNDSKYFNQFGTYDTIGAYQSQDSPYYTFYKKKWINGEETFDYWWGQKNLPECDSNSVTWKKYILGESGIIDKWFGLGIDGLRLDVADELSDEYIQGIAETVKRNKPDGLILGEVWVNPMSQNRGYISSGKAMHSVMNYWLIDALIRYYKYCDVWKLDSVLKEIESEYPTPTIQTLMNFTSTHDISRAVEIFGCNAFQKNGEWSWNLCDDSVKWIENHQLTTEEYKYGKKVYKSYLTVLAFLPGIFSIFYGDEVGTRGIGNLANRAPYPWGHRDKDLLKFVRRIGKIRKGLEFLKKAEWRSLKLDSEQFCYERYDDNQNKLLVLVSKVNYATKVEIPEEYKNAEVIFSIQGSDKKALSPYGAIVLKA